MRKLYLSNALLGLGVLFLLSFGVIEVNGLQSNPLLPAFAALLIGCTAVLDRVSFLNPK
jgi:uncharacterized membrane protein